MGGRCHESQRPKILDLRKVRIIKDVLRTDRNISFYQRSSTDGPIENPDECADLEAKIDNKNTRMLKDILVSYCYYNPSLEYVQGMSDLLSPLLYVVQNEALAFWMFVNYMNTMVESKFF